MKLQRRRTVVPGTVDDAGGGGCVIRTNVSGRHLVFWKAFE